jgi:hypothetical protein
MIYTWWAFMRACSAAGLALELAAEHDSSGAAEAVWLHIHSLREIWLSG